MGTGSRDHCLEKGTTTLYAIWKRCTVNLTIKKSVTGNMGDVSKEFTFNYSYTDGDTTESKSFHAITNGGEYTIQNVPVGVTLKLQEQGDFGYRVTAVYNGQTLYDGAANEIEMRFPIVEGADKIEINNHRDAVPDTGVMLDSMPYIIILVLVLAGAILFCSQQTQEIPCLTGGGCNDDRQKRRRQKRPAENGQRRQKLRQGTWRSSAAEAGPGTWEEATRRKWTGHMEKRRDGNRTGHTEKQCGRSRTGRPEEIRQCVRASAGHTEKQRGGNRTRYTEKPDISEPEQAAREEKDAQRQRSRARDSRTARAKKQRQQEQLRRGYLDLLVRVVLLVAAGWILLTQVFLITQASGNGMFPALKDGDLVFAYRLQREYAKNDVVVYEADGEERIGRHCCAGDGCGDAG